MKRRDNADLRERLVIARVGWCDHYDGDPDDAPRNGGKHNDTEIGSEHRNFVARRAVMRGFARSVRNGRLNLARVSATPAADEGTYNEHVNDVCVAMIAKSDRVGQVLVGWHRHATLYAITRRTTGCWWVWTAPARDAILLPVTSRILRVPRSEGATGESNITYTRDRSGALYRNRIFIDEIRRFIAQYGPRQEPSAIENLDAVIRGRGFQYDAIYRDIIEKRAMIVVRRHLSQGYAKVVDHSATESYDFLCLTKSGRSRKIEVKGTTTNGKAVLISANEYVMAQKELVDLYVVRDIRLATSGDRVVAYGGTLSVYRDWGHGGHAVAPIGYSVVLGEPGGTTQRSR
jgi:hypothetical protein